MNAPATVRFAIIINYGGIERELEVTGHESMQSVLERAINLFEVQTNRHILALFDEGNHEFTDLAQSVETAGIKKGDTLVLRQREVQGG